MRKEKYEREVKYKKENRINPSNIYHKVPDASSISSKIAEVIIRVELNHRGNSWEIGFNILLHLYYTFSLSILVSCFTSLSSNGSLLFIEFRLITRILQTSRMSCWVNCLLKYNLRDFQLDIHERKVINQGKLKKEKNGKRIWKSQSHNSTQILYLPLN